MNGHRAEQLITLLLIVATLGWLFVLGYGVLFVTRALWRL